MSSHLAYGSDCAVPDDLPQWCQGCEECAGNKHTTGPQHTTDLSHGSLRVGPAVDGGTSMDGINTASGKGQAANVTTYSHDRRAAAWQMKSKSNKRHVNKEETSG